jgi:hypothetical protein
MPPLVFSIFDEGELGKRHAASGVRRMLAAKEIAGQKGLSGYCFDLARANSK